jgi:hypothetical protein
VFEVSFTPDNNNKTLVNQQSITWAPANTSKARRESSCG